MTMAAALLISEPSQVFLITLTMVGGAFLGLKLLVPLVQALARRLDPHTGAGPVVTRELGELQTRVQELEAQQGRVLELEDRLDFAERLLAQQRDPARLQAGSEPE
jgi:hypothetical protein